MAGASMQRSGRRGITVLALLLLIIALMVAGFFLVRYLRTRQGTTEAAPLVRPEPQQGALRQMSDPSLRSG